MPQPTKGQVHVDRPLTNIALAFMQDESDFVTNRLFPMVPVNKQSDKYFVYDKKQWFRTDAQKRGPGTETPGSGFTLSTDSYFCDVWGIHVDVDDQTRANSDEPIQPDRDATEFVMRDILLKKEKEWIDAFMATSVWGADFTPAIRWDAAGSDPLVDVRAQKREIKSRTGMRGNVFTVTPDVDDILKDHPVIVDRIKGIGGRSAPATVLNQALAEMFEVDDYVVLEVVEDTTAENLSNTETLAHVSVNKALLLHRPAAPGVKVPAAGYTFAWTGLPGSQAGVRIKNFRLEKLDSDRIEGEYAFDHKLTAPELGQFFATPLT